MVVARPRQAALPAATASRAAAAQHLQCAEDHRTIGADSGQRARACHDQRCGLSQHRQRRRRGRHGSRNPARDFGSVMATTLGRSAANYRDPLRVAKTAKTIAAPPSAAGSTQQAPTPAGAGVDAIAWIAQALMPASQPQAAPTSDWSAADCRRGGRRQAPSSRMPLAAGQSTATSVSANRARFNATTAAAGSDRAGQRHADRGHEPRHTRRHPAPSIRWRTYRNSFRA